MSIEQMLGLHRKEKHTGLDFLGELDSTFLTYADLCDHFGVEKTNMNATAQANKWLHFKRDGVELITSKVSVRGNITWGYLYSKGLVYGVNGFGRYPVGLNTNQYRTITISGRVYKCRLMTGADTDPSTSSVGLDIVGTRNSEWSALFYPIIIDDPNIVSYTGPKLANYTDAELQMTFINNTATPGTYAWCQEKHPRDTFTNARVQRGRYGAAQMNLNEYNATHANFGWRPILELVG